MLDNKLGKTFEELAEDELNQINAGGISPTIATPTPSSVPCSISASVTLSLSAAVSYYATR